MTFQQFRETGKLRDWLEDVLTSDEGQQLVAALKDYAEGRFYTLREMDEYGAILKATEQGRMEQLGALMLLTTPPDPKRPKSHGRRYGYNQPAEFYELPEE